MPIHSAKQRISIFFQLTKRMQIFRQVMIDMPVLSIKSKHSKITSSTACQNGYWYALLNLNQKVGWEVKFRVSSILACFVAYGHNCPCYFLY